MKIKVDEIEKFSTIINNIVDKDKITYMEAIVEYCEEVGLEIEVAAKLLTTPIIAKLAEEARSENMLEKIPTLPI